MTRMRRRAWSRVAVSVAGSIALGTAPAAAQGTNAGLVLQLPSSARSLAIGGGGVALALDDASIFFNPAQLAAGHLPAASVSAQRYLEASMLTAGSAAFRGPMGIVGVGLRSLAYGSEPEFVPDPAYGGERGLATGSTVSAADLAAAVAWAVAVGRVRVGAGATVVRQRIADAAGTGAAFDVGSAADLPFGIVIAAAVQHLGGRVVTAGTAASLPRTVRVGISAPYRRRAFALLATGEAVRVRGGDLLPSGGGEVSYYAANGIAVSARVGMIARRADSAVQPTTVGGGLAGEHVALDYAYEGFRYIGGATHRVGLRWWR